MLGLSIVSQVCAFRVMLFFSAKASLNLPRILSVNMILLRTETHSTVVGQLLPKQSSMGWFLKFNRRQKLLSSLCCLFKITYSFLTRLLITGITWYVWTILLSIGFSQYVKHFGSDPKWLHYLLSSKYCLDIQGWKLKKKFRSFFQWKMIQLPIFN